MVVTEIERAAARRIASLALLGIAAFRANLLECSAVLDARIADEIHAICRACTEIEIKLGVGSRERGTQRRAGK